MTERKWLSLRGNTSLRTGRGHWNVRLKNEDLLSKKAFEQPWFGWGGWGRSRVFNDEGTDISITDGRWIIIFGQLGVIGLVGTYGTLLCPCIAAIRRYGGQLCRLRDPRSRGGPDHHRGGLFHRQSAQQFSQPDLPFERWSGRFHRSVGAPSRFPRRSSTQSHRPRPGHNSAPLAAAWSEAAS